MANVLLLLAHPAFHNSRVNRALIEAVSDLKHVTIHDLYERYPDFYIAVETEQQMLLAHDVIIFQHPMQWYSSPAILKEWQDAVLEPGFSHGPGGTALAGKTFISSITTGGSLEAYRREGTNYFTIRELLAPFEQTVRLCRMRCLPPFVVHSANQISLKQITHAASQYRSLLIALGGEKLDLEVCTALRYINDAPFSSDLPSLASL